MIPHGLGDSWGGGMILKNPPPGGVMIVKTGGAMILKNPAPKWGHVSEKSQPDLRNGLLLQSDTAGLYENSCLHRVTPLPRFLG